MKIRLLWLALLMCNFAVFAVEPPSEPVDATPAVAAPKFIDGEYFIMFRDTLPGEVALIPAPDLTLKDRPGFVPPHKMGYKGNTMQMRYIESVLQLRGEVEYVYETINSVFVHMDAVEAERLSHNPLVKLVEQNVVGTIDHVQGPTPNPGWALDRMDKPAVQGGSDWALDNTYHWWHNEIIDNPIRPFPYCNPAYYTTTNPVSNCTTNPVNNTFWNDTGNQNEEHWLYILDTGLDFTGVYPAVLDEFRDQSPGDPSNIRAISFAGNNSANTAQGCKKAGSNTVYNDHGTKVASVAIGKTYGIGKRQYARIVNITTGDPAIPSTCAANAENVNFSYVVAAFDWLAKYASRGSVVNGSWHDGINASLQAVVKAAYNSGVITVVAAGNGVWNPNTFRQEAVSITAANTTPQTMTEVLDVAASCMLSTPSPLYQLCPDGAGDKKAILSNYGSQVDMFAPGIGVAAMSGNGTPAYSWVNIDANNLQSMYGVNGTSFSAPYVSGLIAVICQITTQCNTIDTNLTDADHTGMDNLYNYLKGLEVCTGGIPPATLPNALCPSLNIYTTPLVVNGAGDNTTRRFIRVPPSND
ncbi:MAG: S8 family serine peptidase [Methylobacter sp.]|nr:S8 family serine peptidase [Methylobacter sp.]